MKKNIFVVLVVLSQFIFIPSINSQDYFKPNIGDALRLSISGQIYDARTLSMGNSNSVFNDTYTATLLNPATLGLARKFTINTSVGANLYNNEAFFINDSLLSKRTETVLYQLGLVIPLVSDSAINNYIPRELLLSYPEFDPGSNEYLGDRTIFNSNLNQEGYVLEEGGINHWSFGVAGELAYNIFFGASFN
ncbi:MAG: hypothetical protein MUE93_02550, partial [Ignavibacteriaceae bacterium]|nr:hypothetical protein [Ignavibacteriaceae bacterium]